MCVFVGGFKSHCCLDVHQAVIEIYEDRELCALPLEFVSVVLKPGTAPELLWRVSLALDAIGLHIVELSVFDRIAEIRRQRNKM